MFRRALLGSGAVRLSPALALACLAPAALAQVTELEPVTVSATRAAEPASSVPFTVDALGPLAFQDGPSLTVDDALRGSADFSLFRRNDSLTANPTTQGVSLRGLGPSGASRSLVLLDGVPLNDPFGGWVPWSSVPPGSVARAEIVPGGGAAAWGNEALAGVVQLFSAEPAPGAGSLAAFGGGFGTWGSDLSQALAVGGGTLDLRLSEFSTGGTPLIAPESKGPVDVDAASRHNAESVRWRGGVGSKVSATVALRHFDEWRDNGTPYQQNTLRSTQASAALDGALGEHGSWNATAYAQTQDASQSFSSVNAARTAETPASDQFDVPASAVGAAGTATLADGAGGRTSLGLDVRDVAGETREDFLYSKGAFTEKRFAGGRQLFAGIFAERSQDLGAGVHVLAGARVDRWDLTDGHLRTTSDATGAVIQDTPYPDRSGTEFSPSAGAVWRPLPGLSLHAAAQRAFRVPTLNELYRPFRQGTTTVLSNPALEPEHADSAEVGASLQEGRFKATLEGFAARLSDPVANVTLAQGPGTFPLFGTLAAGATGQERLNLGRLDTLGVQAGASWSPTDTVSLELSLVDEEATIGSAPVAPLLVGKAPTEVPRWSASLGGRWQPLPDLSLVVRARWTGAQFDDDMNTLVLASACQVDASVRYRVSGHASLFAAAQNLAEARIETALSTLGVFSVAPPRTVRAGASVSW